MRFKEPQKRKDKNGKKVLYIVDEMGDIYHLKSYDVWKEVHIAREPSGYYSIIKNRVATEFEYRSVQYTKKYLIAYYKEEEMNNTKFHIYNSHGFRVKYEWLCEDQGNGFIRIESGTIYFINSKKMKAYAKYHPKYWVKRLF